METIEDILREMRDADGVDSSGWFTRKHILDWIDRIEAAAKEMREENAKLRERLSEAVREKCHCCDASEDDRRELCDQCIVADWKEAIAANNLVAKAVMESKKDVN